VVSAGHHGQLVMNLLDGVLAAIARPDEISPIKKTAI
jgi:hypothetical protein